MDWDKTINSLCEIARRTFVLAFSVTLIMACFGSVYMACLTLLWLIKHAQAALGS